VLLSGKAQIIRDGLTLAPELQLLLAIDERRGPLVTSSAEELRIQQEHGARLAAGRATPVGRVRDLTIDGADAPLRARHYAPEGTDARDAPLLVFLHGGGFVFGSVDTHDAPCRILCTYGRMHVLSVEYRLAPEHPFPAAVEDARAALRWASSHASTLGADPSRVGIGGDSAGANLAAAVCLLAATDGGPSPACQMLVYPAVDRTKAYPSLSLFAEGFFLTHASIRWFHRQYVGGRRELDRDPRLGPLHAESLADLPPALVVTAGFDPLRDEGEAYADALGAHGTRVTQKRYSSLIHGFLNLVGVSPLSRKAVIEIAVMTRALFGR
jgi:acetyl esterase